MNIYVLKYKLVSFWRYRIKKEVQKQKYMKIFQKSKFCKYSHDEIVVIRKYRITENPAPAKVATKLTPLFESRPFF